MLPPYTRISNLPTRQAVTFARHRISLHGPPPLHSSYTVNMASWVSLLHACLVSFCFIFYCSFVSGDLPALQTFSCYCFFSFFSGLHAPCGAYVCMCSPQPSPTHVFVLILFGPMRKGLLFSATRNYACFFCLVLFSCYISCQGLARGLWYVFLEHELTPVSPHQFPVPFPLFWLAPWLLALSVLCPAIQCFSYTILCFRAQTICSLPLPFPSEFLFLPHMGYLHYLCISLPTD